MQKQEIRVAYDDGHLAVHIPGLGVRAIEGPDADGLWTGKPGDDRFSFIMDEAGKVRTMILIETIPNTRIDGEARSAGWRLLEDSKGRLKMAKP